MSDAGKDTVWRAKAIEAVGEFGSDASEAVPDIVNVLNGNPDIFEQIAAVATLGKIGTGAKAAVPTLSTRLNHELLIFRLEPALAIWRITGNTEDTIPVIVEVLQNVEPPLDRFSAALTLSEFGPAAKSAIPALQAALELPEAYKDLEDGEDAYGLVRVQIASALWEISQDGTVVVPSLIEQLVS
ncbi:MAG: hypothetical protein CMJ48_08380, partial [Planctomycetaceae bacterium]|nr:hypothetical protein [Planctomycetaceae bacterium]